MRTHGCLPMRSPRIFQRSFLRHSLRQLASSSEPVIVFRCAFAVPSRALIAPRYSTPHGLFSIPAVLVLEQIRCLLPGPSPPAWRQAHLPERPSANCLSDASLVVIPWSRFPVTNASFGTCLRDSFDFDLFVHPVSSGSSQRSSGRFSPWAISRTFDVVL